MGSERTRAENGIAMLALLIIMSIIVTACESKVPSNPTAVVAGAAATPTGTSAPPAVVAPALVTPALTTPVGTATAEQQPTATSTTEPEATPSTTASAMPSTTATPEGYATFTLSRYAARAGETVTLLGQGFAPGETVSLRFGDNPAVAAGDYQANDRGEISVQALRIPALPEGDYSLVAAGGTSSREATRVVNVIGFHPWVVLSQYALQPGQSFGFAGSEFVPGEQVQVFLDGAKTPMLTATADDRGELRQETLMQTTPAQVGKHNLEFVGQQSGSRLPVSFEVLAYVPIMELTSYAGTPGSTVAFTGHGFAPGETIHAYTEGNGQREELTTFQANGQGVFENAGQFVVPADTPPGALTIGLEGEDSRVPVTQHFGVMPLAPWAGLSAYSGPPGTQVTLLGKGFAAGEPVRIFLGSGNGAKELTSGTADGSGELRVGPVAIPADAQASQSFTLRGQNSHGEATVQFSVTSAGQ